VKLNNLIQLNAILFLALGIAFAVYGPLGINAFGMLDISGADGAAYWFTASFARLLGAGLFGYGFLLWAVSDLVAGDFLPPVKRQRIVLALLLANIVGLFVAVTQQWQVWINLAGWITIAIYSLLTLAYAYFMVQTRS
jgi:hypothetical protein